MAAEQVELEIEPDNWDTVMLFCRVQTQWRYSFGGRAGLDYPAVFATMDRLKVADPDGLVFEGIQVMEAASLKAGT